MNKEMLNNILKFSLVLVIVGMVAGGSLSFVYLKTKSKIEEQQKKEELAAKNVIFKDKGYVFKKIKKEGIEYEEVYKNGKLEGYLFKAYGPGYSSVIVTLVGVDTNFNIKGIVILSQAETPGLGARIKEVKSDKYIFNFWKKKSENTKPWFEEQFEGLNALSLKLIKGGKEYKDLDDKAKEKLKKKNEITALSGATISSNAVLSSIKAKADSLYKILKK